MPTVTVIHNNQQEQITCTIGVNLRILLLQHGFSPYTTLTKRLNCGGNGICATCGVWIESGEPPPRHWHDDLADRFGYPRLSCQISVNDDMTVRLLDDKWIWGKRDPERTGRAQQYSIRDED